MDDASRRARLADWIYAAGGAALLASAFVHWVAVGAGSGLRGHDLVDTVVDLGRHVPGMSAARLTVVWYAVPISGAAAWISCGLTGARSIASRVIAVAALVATVLAWIAFARLIGTAKLGWGPKLAFAGAVVLGASAFAPRRWLNAA